MLNILMRPLFALKTPVDITDCQRFLITAKGTINRIKKSWTILLTYMKVPL